MFRGKRFVTSGIAEKVPLLLQVTMWNMIDTMDEPKDYLQVFDLSEENGKQKIERGVIMSIYLRIILVVISMLSMLNILKRVRKSKLQIEYSIFWIVFSILLILVAVFPQPMFVLAQILGIQSPANMVFLFVIFILLIKLFNMTIEVSQLQYKQQELVQKIALDENKKTEKKSSKGKQEEA